MAEQALRKKPAPKKILYPLSKRKARGDRRATSWVLRHIKIKSESVEPGNLAESPTDCYGSIDFKGASRKSRAEFVRFSHKTSPADIYQLMNQYWNLDKPRLLISVSGDSEDFCFSGKLKPVFQAGIHNVAQTPGAWVITGGTNVGVNKVVGEALHGSTKACIGISNFNTIKNREYLISSRTENDLGGTFPYLVSSSLVAEGEYLDHNHTHHLLVDDGEEKGNSTSAIEFRAQFEKFVMENAVGKVPAVYLILRGGIDTIKTVWSALFNNLPVSIVVVKDSGKAADLMAYALELANSMDGEIDVNNANILEMTSKLFPQIDEEEQKTICKKVVYCAKKRDSFTIFRIGGDVDIDEAILMALLSGEKLCSVQQLHLTLIWDRVDLAKEKILSRCVKWKMHDLHAAMVMSLALNRVDFVKLLLDFGVSMELLLTNDILEFLYGYQSRSATSTLNFEIDSKDYVAPRGKYPSIVDLLCSLEGINPWKCAIPRKIIEQVVNYLCKHLTGTRDKGFIERVFLDGSADCEVGFTYPYRELFFWAVLNNNHKMAMYLWQFGEEATTKALIAAEINNVLCKHALQLDLQDDLVQSLKNNAKEFGCLALGLLDECYREDESKTVQLITCEFNQFSNQTCLGLAVTLNNLDFVSHSAVQLLLNEIWTGKVKAREVSHIQIISAYIFPPLINNIPFHSDAAFKAMLFINDDTIELCSVGTAYACLSTGDLNHHRASVLKRKTPTTIRCSYRSFRARQAATPYYKKVYQFYFETPVIKFYANVLSYCLFLALFAYVCMVGEHVKTPLFKCFLVAYIVALTVAEIHQIVQNDGLTLKTKLMDWSSSLWNRLDATAIILFFVAYGLKLNKDTKHVSHVILAVDGGFWVIRLLSVFFVHRVLGPYVVMIFRMTRDLMYFVAIFFVFLISYGVTSNAILKPRREDVGLGTLITDVVFHPYFNIFGELFINNHQKNQTRFGTPYASSYSESVALFLLGVYLLIMNVLLLNILIAAFNNTFNSVQENAAQIWKFQRLGLVLEYAQRAIVPPPFSLIVHVLLLLRWLLQRCSIMKKKYVGNRTLKARLSSDEKEELIEFETKCMTKFIRKNELIPEKTLEKCTVEILKSLEVINADISQIKDRMRKM